VYRGIGGTKGAQKEQEIVNYFYGKGSDNHQLGTVFWYTTE